MSNNKEKVAENQIHVRKTSEEELKRFRQAVETAGHAIYITDREGTIEYVNPAFTSITGYSRNEALGKNPNILKSGVQDEAYYKRLWDTLKAGKPWREEVVNKRKNGDLYYAFQTVTPLFGVHHEIEGYVAIQADITVEKRLEEQLRKSESRYRSVISAMMEGVVLRDAEGNILAMNQSAERILGISGKDVRGKKYLFSHMHAVKEDGTPMTKDEHPAMIALKTGKPQSNFVIGLKKPEGNTIWVSINAQPIMDPGEDTPHAVVTTFADITERKMREEEIRKISVTDHLTQIYNRYWFYKVLDDETKRSVRYHTALSLIMFDIDHFKRINDSFGHGAGDKVLKGIAQTVGSLLRTTDTFARWGGEEFVVLTPNTGLETSMKLAERIRSTVESLFFDGVGEVTVSLGVAEYNGSGKETKDLFVKRADEALYQAKDSGRNRVIASTS